MMIKSTNTFSSGSVICLMGPTASGKSKIAMQLAEKLPIEIVNVDSAIVYRGMNIGTAKPAPEELAKIQHHLIDIRDPAQSYSAADFRTDALVAIKKIIARGKVPLLVGGTMLYFKALQEGLSELPSADKKIREKISAEAKQIGWQGLHQRLKKVDPKAAKKIHPNDAQRIQRALEVFMLTGKTISELCGKKKEEASLYEFINIAIAPKDRKLLHERIERRFEDMLKRGFIDEVKALYGREDLNRDLPAMRAVGYRQVWDYLAGDLDFEQMKYKAIVATRQLAKRQLTWLRSWPNVCWFDSEALNLVEEIYKLINN
jgi:tRNA dimethylallyltransferase